jgi:hypothetical protein
MSGRTKKEEVDKTYNAQIPDFAEVVGDLTAFAFYIIF